MPKLAIRHKGNVHDLEVCYSAQQCEEILARWPGGVIELEHIFEHETPSSMGARVFIVNAIFALTGEPLIAPLPFGFLPRAEQGAAFVASARAALVRSYSAEPTPEPTPEP